MNRRIQIFQIALDSNAMHANPDLGVLFTTCKISVPVIVAAMPLS